MEKKRVLCLDVGDARTGVAVSDPLGITAQGVEVIKVVGREKDALCVKQIADRYGTDRVVLGLPKNMDGSLGGQAEKVRKFAKELRRLGLQTRFQDERMTTKIAEQTLIEGGTRRADRKKSVDQLAAVIILQSFLDAGGWPEDETTI